MSDLLNSASLVMIPSGYKEDIVYSPIPTNGNGDLSFTRASNGTRVNSAGLVEDVAWNLLEYSEDFANAYWYAEAGNTVTSNSTTAPNGTLTADTLTATPTNVMNVHNFSSFTITANTYTLSQYLKNNGTNLIESYIYNPATGFVARGEINFANGTFTASVGSGSIENVGNGWYRISLTASLASGSVTTGFFTTSTTGTRTVFVWGAQLNIGSTAKPYFPTTDRLNVPRLTYQNGGGGCPSLLLEKQSTNLATYSEDITQWSGSLSVTANDTTSPDGTQNADKVTSSANTATRYRFFSGNANCTVSIFAKKVDSDYILISYGQPSTKYAIFRFSDGVCTTVTSSITTTSTNYGNGWWRFSMSTTNQSAGYIELCPNASGTTFDSAGSCYVWGAQYEDLSSYPTSYIPTTSSSATRVADACSKTGISSLIGQTQGVLFADFYAKGSYDSNNLLMLISTGSGGELIYLNLVGGTIEAYIAASSAQQFLYTSGTVLTANTRHKLAIAYANNDIALYHNGTQLATDTSASIPACTLVRVGDFLGGTYQFGNMINQAILFPTRLTNAELASITSL